MAPSHHRAGSGIPLGGGDCQARKAPVRLGEWPLWVRPIETSGGVARSPVGAGLPAVDSLRWAENGMLGVGEADGASLGWASL